MSITPVEEEIERVTRVRPGHADLPGSLKYRFDDVRNVLERASARETAARVAVAGIAKRLLDELTNQVRAYLFIMPRTFIEIDFIKSVIAITV